MQDQAWYGGQRRNGLTIAEMSFFLDNTGVFIAVALEESRCLRHVLNYFPHPRDSCCAASTLGPGLDSTCATQRRGGLGKEPFGDPGPFFPVPVPVRGGYEKLQVVFATRKRSTSWRAAAKGPAGTGSRQGQSKHDP